MYNLDRSSTAVFHQVAIVRIIRHRIDTFEEQP
jgi:hypothetical protein